MLLPRLWPLSPDTSETDSVSGFWKSRLLFIEGCKGSKNKGLEWEYLASISVVKGKKEKEKEKEGRKSSIPWQDDVIYISGKSRGNRKLLNFRINWNNRKIPYCCKLHQNIEARPIHNFFFFFFYFFFFLTTKTSNEKMKITNHSSWCTR